MSKTNTLMRTVVKEPETDSSAGFGISYRPNAPPHLTEYAIEQLWPDGTAEPVYIGDRDDALRLIEELSKLIREESDNAAESE